MDDKAVKVGSQCNQDEFVAKYFSHLCHDERVFVEVGAGDGKRFSNTYKLQYEYGWSGLLIEPHPELFGILKGRETDSVKALNVAVTRCAMPLPFICFDGEFREISHLKTYSGEHDNLPHRIVSVQTFPLSVLMDHTNTTSIDYLSIDVEGHELDVINSMNFRKTRVHLMTVENNSGSDSQRDHIERLGFDWIGWLGWDDLFVNSKL